MARRNLSILLGLLAVGLFALSGYGTAQDEKPAEKHNHEAHAGPSQHCAVACSTCMRECESCAHHCARLVAGGHKDHMRTLGTCSDCAEFCAAAAKIVSRHGPLANTMCESCAKACDSCGAACEKFSDDTHMQACAKACRDCAKACRTMIQETGQANATGE
jgi:hypothetical protein